MSEMEIHFFFLTARPRDRACEFNCRRDYLAGIRSTTARARFLEIAFALFSSLARRAVRLYHYAVLHHILQLRLSSMLDCLLLLRRFPLYLLLLLLLWTI